MGDTIAIINDTYLHDIQEADKRGFHAFNAWANGDAQGTD
jgi:hypothetical protein